MIDTNMVDSVHRVAAAHDRLLEKRPVGEGFHECFSVEAAVLGALAIEIGMKALIYEAKGLECFSDARNAITPRNAGHDLKHLFGLLTNEQRRDIFASIAAQGPQKWTYQVLSENEDAALAIASWIQEVPEFDKLLEMCSRTFEAFRYSYEKTNIVTCITFIDVLLKAVISVLPPKQPPDR